MGRGINLPQEYFHCPELSKREKQYLIQKAQDSAKALVESARSSHGPVRWVEAGSHKGVQMYKGEGRNPSGSAEQIQYVCGATTIQATIEEVASFMDVSTTPKMKSFVPHQHELLDGLVLYTLVPPSPENQFLHQVTVKWMAAHIPSKLIKDRDFLTLECQDVFTDTTGRRGWVRSYHSVKLPCCPDLQAELGFVRGSFYHTGYVFVESDRAGWLDCIHTCQVNLKGNLKLPSSIYFLAMKRRIGSVAALGRTLQQRRLGRHKFLSDLELVPKSQRSRCHVCAAKFGVLTRKSRCRKCGEVVCHQCTQTWEVSLPTAGVKKVRVCATCASSGDLNTTTAAANLHHLTADEISLLSSDHRSAHNYESDDPQQPSPLDAEYLQHQQPLQLNSTMVDDPRFPSHHYGFSPSAAMAPSPHQLPGPGPQSLASRPTGHRPSVGPAAHLSHRGSASYDPEPYRPIGFVHQSEYETPRGYDHALPGRRGPAYPGEYRDEYADDYGRGYGPPGQHQYRDPRYRDDYHHYQDGRDYDYYGHGHGHGHGAPPRRYPSESVARRPHADPLSRPSKHRRAHPTEETASSSSDQSIERSLTAHALERHTRQMGRPGPVPPHSYEYERPAPPPPQPPHHHHHQQQHQPRPSYHHAPSYPNGYAPPPPQSAPYRDSVQSRGPPMHHDEIAQSDYGYEHQRRSFYDDNHQPAHVDRGYQQPAALPQPQPEPEPRAASQLEPRQSSAWESRPSVPEVIPESPASVTAPASGQEASLAIKEEIVRLSRSTSPEQEEAEALAANASWLMQQQQQLQDQLSARAQALSFSSDQRFSEIEQDDDDDDAASAGGENGLEDWSTGSPTSRAMLNEFRSLQLDAEPEPARPTMDSYRHSASSSVLATKISFAPSDASSSSALRQPEQEKEQEETTNFVSSSSYGHTSAGKMGAELTKLSVVQLYQQILELTKKQHALETNLQATAAEKDAVAKELSELYKKLNEVTAETEVAF